MMVIWLSTSRILSISLKWRNFYQWMGLGCGGGVGVGVGVGVGGGVGGGDAM